MGLKSIAFRLDIIYYTFMLLASAIIFVASNVYKPVELVSEILKIDKQIILTIAHIESNFKASAVSSRGAKGIMQVMPANLSALKARKDSSVENIIAGAIILKRYLRMFDGDLLLALAAYNAGPQAVKRYRGVPPYWETRNYLKKFVKNYRNNTYREKKTRGTEQITPLKKMGMR